MLEKFPYYLYTGFNLIYICVFKIGRPSSIREIITTQIVLNKFNEHQVPLARQFIAKHVSTSLSVLIMIL
jgi:hypothetical protein